MSKKRMRVTRLLVLLLASSFAFGQTPSRTDDPMKETLASPASHPLSPALLRRLMALLTEQGRDVVLEKSMSTALGLPTSGQGWSGREIGARDNEADTSSQLHNVAMPSEGEDAIVLSHWVDTVSHYIRVRRTGEVVKAVSYEPSVGTKEIPLAAAGNEASEEFEFWDKHAERTGYWLVCTGDLKGERAVDPTKKLAACTWLIQSGNAQPGEVATAYVQRAWAHGREHAEMTRDDLSQAVRVDPANWNGWAQLCSIQTNIDKDLKEAIESCSKALELNPHSPEAWTFRGDIHLRNKEYDEAIADYNHAIKLAPRWMWPLDNRGEAYLRMNQIDRAIADFDSVIQVSPDYAMGYLDRGIAEMKEEDRKLAMDFFERGIKLDPNCAACFFGRGLVRRMNGDQVGAQTDLTKARALDSKVEGEFAEDGITAK
jgi:tetratricopeptide (TPR) repeat protein